MQSAPGTASPNGSPSMEDSDQVEEDNIRNLHFSTVPIVTTGIQTRLTCKLLMRPFTLERCTGPSELIGHTITLFDSTFFVIGGKLPSEETYFNDVCIITMR
jgi:hypothetical protein